MLRGGFIVKSAFWAALAAVTALSVFSLDPTPTPGQSDKLKHFTAYAVLGALGVMAFRANGASALRLIAALALYGCALEGVQYTLPDRMTSAFDAAANGLGAAAGAVCASALLRARFVKKRSELGNDSL